MTASSDEALIQSLSERIAAIEGKTLTLSDEEGQTPAQAGATSSPEDDVGDGDEADRAYQNLLELIAIREHSTRTMAKRLRRGGFSSNAIDDAVARAVAVGIIDDRRYADMLMLQRLASGKGLRFVLREIEELGIDPATLDAYEDYASGGEEAERRRAVAFLDRHPTRSKNLRAGAYRKLVTQGFSSGVASAAARQWAAAREDMES